MNDKYDGVGGSYLLDPKTGKRKLIERTQVEITISGDIEKEIKESVIPAINEATKKP